MILQMLPAAANKEYFYGAGCRYVVASPVVSLTCASCFYGGCSVAVYPASPIIFEVITQFFPFVTFPAYICNPK